MMTIIMFLEGKMNESESILQAQKPTRWSTLRGGELGKTDFERFFFNWSVRKFSKTFFYLLVADLTGF